MRPRFLLSEPAARDLQDIADFISRQSGPARAAHVTARILAAIRRASEMPGLGHTRRELKDTALRVWPVYSYLIIYRTGTHPLQVVRILHGARDLPRRFSEE